MKTSEHLTSNQIAAFGAGALALTDSRTVGGHLIQCAECRSQLPTPDPVRVWSAVTSEHDFGDLVQTDSSSSSKESYAEKLFGFFDKRNRLAWAGGLLTMVVTFAALLIFSLSNERGVETDIARSSELESPVLVPIPDHGQPNEVPPGSSQIDSGGKEADPVSTNPEARVTRSKSAVRSTATHSRVSNGMNRNISSTRGAVTPCTIWKSIEVELGTNKTDLVLRWKRVPKAAKYHLYVSDDNEVLVDEFETDQETSYVLKKQLDPTKSYKWKIIVTLEDGQKLFVDAPKFKARDFQSSLSEYKRSKSNTRCLVN